MRYLLSSIKLSRDSGSCFSGVVRGPGLLAAIDDLALGGFGARGVAASGAAGTTTVAAAGRIVVIGTSAAVGAATGSAPGIAVGIEGGVAPRAGCGAGWVTGS